MPDSKLRIIKLEQQVRALICLQATTSCIADNAADVYIEQMHEQTFKGVNNQQTFDVDTGQTLVVGDVVTVMFLFNGVEQADLSKISSAPTFTGATYNGFVIAGGSNNLVRINTTAPIGTVPYEDWAILRVIIKKNLLVLSGC